MSLIDLYREISDLTRPICSTCTPPYHCCVLAGCEQAADWAAIYYQTELIGTKGPLPFLTKTGCTVAIHMRPLCTTWLCDEGVKKAPPRYFELKAEIVRAEINRLKS